MEAVEDLIVDVGRGSQPYTEAQEHNPSAPPLSNSLQKLRIPIDITLSMQDSWGWRASAVLRNMVLNLIHTLGLDHTGTRLSRLAVMVGGTRRDVIGVRNVGEYVYVVRRH
jgi:hypothetical protein